MPWTTTDLYRRGNASSPRMTHVRIGKDVTVFRRDGVDWVEARSGGVSTSLRPKALFFLACLTPPGSPVWLRLRRAIFSAPGFGNLWWELPAGSEYPDDLMVVNDHGWHFSCEPRGDMLLAGLPFIALELVDQKRFAEFTQRVFATDRNDLPKGLIEVLP